MAAVLEAGEESAEVLLSTLDRLFAGIAPGHAIDVATCPERLTDIALWCRAQHCRVTSAQAVDGHVRLQITRSS